MIKAIVATVAVVAIVLFILVSHVEGRCAEKGGTTHWLGTGFANLCVKDGRIL